MTARCVRPATASPLTPDAVRRLACDAELIPTVLGSTGAVLDQGRARRVATAAQRHALRAMYRTCGHPDCTVRFADCEIHHVIEWIHQHGPTDLANLLPLCNEHHHLVHDAGWHLTLHPDRTITLRRPDGTVAFHGSSIDVAPTGLTTPHTRRARPARRARRVDRPPWPESPSASASPPPHDHHNHHPTAPGRSTDTGDPSTDRPHHPLQEPLRRPEPQHRTEAVTSRRCGKRPEPRR